jgi:hypothetical protein
MKPVTVELWAARDKCGAFDDVAFLYIGAPPVSYHGRRYVEAANGSADHYGASFWGFPRCLGLRPGQCKRVTLTIADVEGTP